LRSLTLGSGLFRMLLRQVMADDAAADRASHSVMAGIVPSNAPYNSALQATCGVGCAHRCEDKRRGNQAQFVCSVHFVTRGNKADGYRLGGDFPDFNRRCLN
jgi:hypothetical protein